MLVTCPQCSTQYNVPLTALPPTGRKTRCAKCGHVWLEGAPPEEAIGAFAAADAVPIPPAAIADPEPDTPVAVKAKKPVKKPRKPLPWGRIAAGAAFLLVTLAGGSVIFRESLATAVPSLSRVYAMAGMPVGNVDDWFKRMDLKADPYTENGEQGLKVSGTYQNVSSLPQEMPRIRIFWQSAEGKVSALVNSTATETQLEPGQSTSFAATLNNLDMSAGGQLGAVLEGGRYDAELTRLIAAPAETAKETAPASPPSHSTSAPAHAAPAPKEH